MYGDPGNIRKILAELGDTWAIVGLWSNERRAAYGVADVLQRYGKRIVPVHPKAETVHGEKGYPSLDAIPFDVDVVDVFVNSDLAGTVADEAAAVGAKAVWFQLGVVDEGAYGRTRAAGLDMVMDRCPAIEIPRLGFRRPHGKPFGQTWLTAGGGDRFAAPVSTLTFQQADDEAGLKDWQYVHNVIVPPAAMSLDEVRERSGRNHLEVVYLGDVLVGCSTVRPPKDGGSTATVIAGSCPDTVGRGSGEELRARAEAGAGRGRDRDGRPGVQRGRAAVRRAARVRRDRAVCAAGRNGRVGRPAAGLSPAGPGHRVRSPRPVTAPGRGTPSPFP